VSVVALEVIADTSLAVIIGHHCFALAGDASADISDFEPQRFTIKLHRLFGIEIESQDLAGKPGRESYGNRVLGRVKEDHDFAVPMGEFHPVDHLECRPAQRCFDRRFG
jgi:hypothetical protein